MPQFKMVSHWQSIAEAVAEEAELACLVLLDGASQPLPLLLRSSEAHVSLRGF